MVTDTSASGRTLGISWYAYKTETGWNVFTLDGGADIPPKFLETVVAELNGSAK